MISILQNPSVFNFIQDFLRVNQVRQYFVDQVVKPSPGNTILDIGCGTGELQPFFRECSYTGFDFDEKYLSKAQAQFGRDGKFILANVCDIDIEENSHDVAIAAGVLHHLTDTEAKALFELAYKSLKPGGRICSFDMCDRGKGFFPTLMNKIDRGKHIRTEEAYTKLARATFSKVEVSDYCGSLLIPVTHCVMVCTKE